MNKPSIYSKLYVKYSRRAKFTPRVGRYWRPRVIAWHGPDPFFRNRFYELDSWYKARIQRPEILPKLHIIDPDQFQESFEQKIFESEAKERTLNIGFKPKEVPWKKSAEQRAQLEDLAIRNQLQIDLDRVANEDHLALAEHFNIFEDLFLPGVYFHNCQSLEIAWEGQSMGEEEPYSRCVQFGNVVRAGDAARAPSFKFGQLGQEGGTGAFNTMLMLNLEGPGQYREGESPTAAQFQAGLDEEEEEQECSDDECPPTTVQRRVPDKEEQLLARLDRPQLLHWFVANVPEKEGGQGEQLVPYLQPVPFMGTGYHRFVFLLFRHRQPIDFSSGYTLMKSEDSPLIARSFNLNTFYKQFESVMTPSALRFCQIKWDPSCDRALHQLGLKSPRYWYDWNAPLKPRQREFPKKAMPFHHYLNMYRNPESVRKEVQKRRLERLVKLKPGEQLAPTYPDIDFGLNRRRLYPQEHDRLMRENVGKGVWAALYHGYENPAEQHTLEKYKMGGKQEEPTLISGTLEVREYSKVK